ncbi:hypothetical protein BH10PSE1_BH10PSE1_02780 [soil metagenome]
MPAEITLRLTIADPVAGMHYSLQDPKSVPVAACIATDAPLSFDVPVKLNDDGRLTGPFVRREGPTRRFVYIAIGGQAGDHHVISRRAKIDVHEIPAPLLDLARAGAVLVVTLPGRDKHGLPACATVRPLTPWAAA